MSAIKSLLRAALVAAMIVPLVASADPVVNDEGIEKPQVSTKTSEAARKIAEINERMAVKQAELSELELQAKIVMKEDEIRKTKNSGTTHYSLEDDFVPSVIEIDGVDGRLKAKLYMRAGNTQLVRVGDMAGKWKVKEIKQDYVTVQKGKEILKLDFGAGATQSQRTTFPETLPGQF